MKNRSNKTKTRILLQVALGPYMVTSLPQAIQNYNDVSVQERWAEEVEHINHGLLVFRFFKN
jgi:hypothetical protein